MSIQFKSVMRRAWYGDKYMQHGREIAEQAITDINADALEWLRQNTPVVTGEWRDGWSTFGPSATPQGVSGGFDNSAPHHRYVNYGWSGFEGYHLAEMAWAMFYTTVGERIRGML